MKGLVALLLVAAAAVAVAHASKAENRGRHPCACSRELAPVCGNDGATYSNQCVLKCAASEEKTRLGRELRVAHDGLCDPETNSIS